MEHQRDLILFVDDQQVARKYFAMMFASDYEVLTAQDAQEAWSLIRKHEDRLAVVVTDQRMPNLTGVDLLMAVRRTHPRIVRLLTTGSADLEEAIDAVNRGDIYAYVHKPWNIEEFGLDLRRAVALYQLQQERDSLLGLQSSEQRHILESDRLHAYGLIAATCSGMVDGALSATLAFWSDSMRHFQRRTQRVLASMRGDQKNHTRRMLFSASEIGKWLASNRSVGESPLVDAAAAAKATAAHCGATVPPQIPAVIMPLDQRLFQGGLQSFIGFLVRLASSSEAATASVTMENAQHGGLDLGLCISGHGSDSMDSPDEQLATERLGLQGYLAIHHHSGTISIRNWDSDGGDLHIHLPATPHPTRRDATARFLASAVRR